MIDTPLRLHPSHYLLLGLVARQPSHGYELARRLKEPGSPGQIWQVRQANLYALLEDLEEADLLKAIELRVQPAPARREYWITTAGSEELKRWLAEPAAKPRDFRPEFLIKHYLTRLLNGDDAARSLRDLQIRTCMAWLSALESPETDDPAEELRLYRREIIQAQLRWLEVLNRLQSPKEHL